MRVWIVSDYWFDQCDSYDTEIVGIFDSFEKAKDYINSVATSDICKPCKGFYERERVEEIWDDEGTDEAYIWNTTWHNYYVPIEGAEVQ